MTDETETTFDMNAHFESIPTDPERSALYTELYTIDGICRNNWRTMPGDVQIAIMDAVERALALVRSL
jgi:hypothetical protein